MLATFIKWTTIAAVTASLMGLAVFHWFDATYGTGALLTDDEMIVRYKQLESEFQSIETHCQSNPNIHLLSFSPQLFSDPSEPEHNLKSLLRNVGSNLGIETFQSRVGLIITIPVWQEGLNGYSNRGASKGYMYLQEPEISNAKSIDEFAKSGLWGKEYSKQPGLRKRRISDNWYIYYSFKS